jgi:hypothetical protein
MTALSIRKAGNNDRIFKINTLMKRPEFFKAANDYCNAPARRQPQQAAGPGSPPKSIRNRVARFSAVLRALTRLSVVRDEPGATTAKRTKVNKFPNAFGKTIRRPRYRDC